METQPVDVRDHEVLELVRALDAELAGGGYAEDEMFGYSPHQLQRGGVHLVGVRVAGRLAGIGGVEVPRFPPYVDSRTSICMQRELA